jgi:hypothetical protein
MLERNTAGYPDDEALRRELLTAHSACGGEDQIAVLSEQLGKQPWE